MNATKTTTDLELVTHFVAGATLVSASGARSGEVYDPATGRVARRVAFADVAEVDLAVAAAREAFPAWRDTPAAQRCRHLLRFRELLSSRAREIAAAISREHGKTIPDALGEVERGLEVVDFACGIPHLLQGSFSHDASRGIDVYALREPLGVVAGVTPFNFPAMLPLWMFPIALACGNAFVLKPSEKDPSAPTLLAEIARDAGLPPGVLNVVHGDSISVARLLEHPDVAAISFVGSTPVARHVYETAARHGKRVQALGGAKNHMVVLDDLDASGYDFAADAAVSAGYGSAGERCMAVSVVVAVGAAGDELVPRIASRLDKLHVGPATDPASEMGPLVTAAHRRRVAGYVDRGVEEGARLVCDGRERAVAGAAAAETGAAGGFFLGPTLFDHVTPDMEIYRDEIFGPVLGVVRVDSLDEAIELVNCNPWANGAAVFTRDGGAARRFEDRVEAGMVGVNVPIPVPVGHCSFGGWRASLFGDTGIYGPEGVRFYTRPKVVTRRWPQDTAGSRSARPDLAFPDRIVAERLVALSKHLAATAGPGPPLQTAGATASPLHPDAEATR